MGLKIYSDVCGTQWILIYSSDLPFEYSYPSQSAVKCKKYARITKFTDEVMKITPMCLCKHAKTRKSMIILTNVNAFAIKF